MRNSYLIQNLFFYVFAFVFSTAIHANISEEVVILKGKYQGVKPKYHAIDEIPISVFIIGNTYIGIQLQHSIGQIFISIYKNGKLIESMAQTLESFSTEYISLQEEGTGLYSIFISTPKGINFYGEFKIE